MEFYQLDNGVRVVLAPMAGVQSTAIGVYTNTGSRNETPNINGLSHFVEHMAFKGTQHYPTTKDTSSLEGLGAVQNAWTDNEATSYYCKIPADKWREGLDLIKDLALYPKFPATDLEIERGAIIEEINRSEDQPDDRVGDVLMELMYDPHTWGMRIIGPADVIRKLARQDFVDYHKVHYISSSLVVVMAGKLEIGNAKFEINKHFGKLPKSQHMGSKEFKEHQIHPQVKIYPKETAEQAHIELAVRGLASSDPRRYTLSVLNALLGSGMSSRLFIEIREKRGLCYSVSSQGLRFTDTGLWSIHAGLNTAKLDEALVAMQTEMRKLKTALVPAQELEEAKHKLRGGIIFAQENPIHQMEYYAHQVLVDMEISDYDSLIDRLMRVTVKDIQRLANELFVSPKLNLAIVGPFAVADENRLAKTLEL